jgi:glutamate-1-semialdehyde 2,1-aminomutase
MRSFDESLAQLAQAERVIPLGSQTFSKSRTQYPVGVSPLFLERGSGARVWDVDGNEYVDFVSSLAAITLGHGDPDVDAAVLDQLKKGVVFSLPSPLETELAELLVEMVPCAEKVRFGKNGSDATAGAIRVARAFTGREHVAVCGYHGWQDWYIGSTSRNLGVPESTRALTHAFAYNDLNSLRCLFDQHAGQIAAVMLEPMNVTEPAPGFLEGVKNLAAEHDAVLIFDETITGFRYANGGAQELFGVTPDLATFGKGLANGYPISALVGRADMMKVMEEIFFSFTFGGEALSIAAAIATLKKLKREPIIASIREQGEKLIEGARSVIDRHDCGSFLSISGNPAWSFLLIQDSGNCSSFDLKTLFMQEMFQQGILTLGSHNLSFAHGPAEIERLLAAYDHVFPLLARAVADGSVAPQLRCDPLQPLFKVR